MHSSYSKLINYEKGKTKIKNIIVVSLIVLLVGTVGMYLSGFISNNAKYVVSRKF